MTLKKSRPVQSQSTGKEISLEVDILRPTMEELTFLFWIFPTQNHLLSFVSYPCTKTQDRRWSWLLGYKSHRTVENQNALDKTHWHCLWTLIKWQLHTLFRVREKRYSKSQEYMEIRHSVKVRQNKYANQFSNAPCDSCIMVITSLVGLPL